MGLGNLPPTISSIAGRSIAVNTSTGPVPFTIGSDGVALTASSSDTNLVPVSQIVVGGSGTSRTVTVTPGLNQSGQAVITLYVLDAEFATPTSFTLTVMPPTLPQLCFTNSVTGSGASLQFYWTGNYKLQAQTNAAGVGLGTNWFDYPGGTSPVNVPINPALGNAFFRLRQ